MISDKMAGAMNTQINAEFYSAYLYLSMSACAADMGLAGAANWFAVQAQEELAHGRKMYDYLISVGRRVMLDTIEKPPSEWESLVAMLEGTLVHEQKVTGLINNLVNIARDERDYATETFLQWFVTEQVEEEDTVKTTLSRVKLAGGDGGALFMIDNELASRTFIPPVDGN